MSTRDYVYDTIELLNDEQLNAIADILKQFPISDNPESGLSDISRMSEAEFNREIEKGIADIEAGKVYSSDLVRKEMSELFKRAEA